MTTAASLASYASSFPSFRNRIINGDMRIDQRNDGGIVTVNSSANFYPVDRYRCTSVGGGAFTTQRDTNAPAGFTNSLKVVVTTADSTLANTSIYVATQVIEGFNIADLGWGTANAKPVILSFWVRSSVAGTMGGVIRNLFDGATASYPFSYEIEYENTWEQKAVTILGPPSGTAFGTTNGEGFLVSFTFGASSNRLGADATWGSNLWGPTGMTQLISTLNATIYYTGLQLEEGTVATPFEHRPIGTELALCQRYAIMFGNNTVDATVDGGHLALGWIDTIDNFAGMIFLPTTMRERPVLNAWGTSNFEIAYTDLSVSTVSGVNISQIRGLTTKNLVFITINSGQTNQHRQQPASIRYADNSLTDTFLLESEL